MIIAEDVEAEALSTLVVNKVRGTFNAVAVKAPGFGDRRKAMLQDMAILTGGQVVAEEVGLSLESVGLEVLGTARRVVATKDTTTIVEGSGDAQAVSDRVAQLQAESAATDSDWDREKIEEGIVAGGGSALVHAAGAADDLGLEGDEAVGASIVRKSAAEPLRWIAENAGLQGYVATTKVAEMSPGQGLNAATGEYGDLFAAGVIDPVKVTRSALRNAASIAAMVLTTDTLVVDKPEGEDEDGGHGHSH